jgi:hypothetical protein
MRTELKRYSAIHVSSGEIRRLVFEAVDIVEARKLARGWKVGLEGETPGDHAGQSAAPIPEAYDQATARRLLGGISRTTLYAELATGQLERVSGTRRVLITRRSIERRCGRR